MARRQRARRNLRGLEHDVVCVHEGVGVPNAEAIQGHLAKRPERQPERLDDCGHELPLILARDDLHHGGPLCSAVVARS